MNRTRGLYDLIEIVLIIAVVLLLPLIPVAFLYQQFGDRNYFGLDGWVRGMVTSGPIAAYVVLVWLFQRFYRNLRRDQLFPEQKAKQLETTDVPDIKGTWRGEWQWKDSDEKVHTFTETFTIDKQDGRVISGTVKDQEGLEAKFRGEIYNRVVALYYVSSKTERLSAGSLTVELSGDSKSMKGEQVYYAIDLNRLVTTPYRLKREP